jgi:hypothetical protein
MGNFNHPIPDEHYSWTGPIYRGSTDVFPVISEDEIAIALSKISSHFDSMYQRIIEESGSYLELNRDSELDFPVISREIVSETLSKISNAFEPLYQRILVD